MSHLRLVVNNGVRVIPRVQLQDHGPFYLAVPLNEAAVGWLRGASLGSNQWIGRGLVIDWRYADDFINVAREYDVEVESV